MKKEVLNVVRKIKDAAEKAGVSVYEITVGQVLENSDLSEWEMRKLGGLSSIKRDYLLAKKKAHPFENFTKEGLGDIVKRFNIKKGVFFITAAAPTSMGDYSEAQIEAAKLNKNFIAANVHKRAFSSVLNFCERNDAELVILPMRAHVRALNNQPQHYDPLLHPFLEKFATEFIFNSRLKAIEAQLNPQQVNPLTGLGRLRGKSDYLFANEDEKGVIKREINRFKMSLIVAHSKQNMEVIATGNDTHPRILHSTGAITEPAYLRNRIGMIAAEDHVLGGLIIEIDGDKFYLRQVQMDRTTGSFVDLGTRYHSSGKTTEERAEAFKMGDIHPGYEDKEVLKAWYELWDLTKPKRIFYEDFFDASSISHHLDRQNVARQLLPDYFKTLDAELVVCEQVLKETFKHAPKDAELIATYSNHPEHLTRYLDEGRYIRDDVNYATAHRMVVMALDGQNPLQEFIDPDKRMRWLGPNEDYFVEGVQCGAHGHLGVNGAKGGYNGLEMAYGNAMLAHSHTPRIIHQVYVVGHSTQKRHGYNKGPSTWIPASGLIYKGGQKQMVMVINGSWRLKK